MQPCPPSPIDSEDANCCPHLSKSLMQHHLDITALVYPYTTHLSGRKCSVCVCAYVWKVGTHCSLAPTGPSLQASSGSGWQAWASVMLDWIIISLIPLLSFSLLPLCSFLFSHCYIVSLSGSQLSRFSDCHRRRRRKEKKKVIIQNAELLHIPEKKKKLNLK